MPSTVYIERSFNHFEALKAQQIALLAQAVSDAASEITIRAQANAPVDTGELRDSIHPESQDAMNADVVSRVEHAVYNEYGTTKMPARPFLTPAVEGAAEQFFEDVANALRGEKKKERKKKKERDDESPDEAEGAAESGPVGLIGQGVGGLLGAGAELGIEGAELGIEGVVEAPLLLVGA